MGILASANAKLLLFGEHAVVHGYPGLGLGLTWKLTVGSRGFSDRWQFTGAEAHAGDLEKALKVIWQSGGLQEPPEPQNLLIESAVPLSSGFGSSAAFCCALARFFFPDFSEDEIWRVAQTAENIFHGKSSGIDTALALREGLWFFTPSVSGPPIVTPVEAKVPILITGSLPRTMDAKNLILGLHQRAQDGDSWVLSSLKWLGDASVTAKNLLQGVYNPAGLGDLANSAQNTLKNLGLSTPAMDLVLENASKAGALGGKLSGAGAGGAFWLVVETAETAQQVIEELTKGTQKIHGFQWLLPPRLV